MSEFAEENGSGKGSGGQPRGPDIAAGGQRSGDVADLPCHVQGGGPVVGEVPGIEEIGVERIAVDAAGQAVEGHRPHFVGCRPHRPRQLEPGSVAEIDRLRKEPQWFVGDQPAARSDREAVDRHRMILRHRVPVAEQDVAVGHRRFQSGEIGDGKHRGDPWKPLFQGHPGVAHLGDRRCRNRRRLRVLDVLRIVGPEGDHAGMIGQPALPFLQQRHLGRRRIGAVFQPRRDVQRAHDAVGQFGVESLPGLDGVEHDVETGVGSLLQMVGTKPAIAGMTGVRIDPDREKRLTVELR